MTPTSPRTARLGRARVNVTPARGGAVSETTLHPDWPAVDIDPTNKWNAPDPLPDFLAALDASGTGVGVEDVASVEAYWIGSDSGRWTPETTEPIATELSMNVLGTLKDGRWFGLEAWNDYTGWGCQDGSDMYVAADRDDVIRNGLTMEARRLLGVPLPGENDERPA